MLYVVCGSSVNDPTHAHNDMVRLGGDPMSLGELIQELCVKLLDPRHDVYIVTSCDQTPSDQMLPNALQRQRQMLGTRYKLQADGSVDRSFSAAEDLVSSVVKDWQSHGAEGRLEPPPTPVEDAQEPPKETGADGDEPLL